MKSDREFIRDVFAAAEEKECLARLACFSAQREKARLWRLFAGGVCALAATLAPLAAAAAQGAARLI